jgi:hypothetical protein
MDAQRGAGLVLAHSHGYTHRILMFTAQNFLARSPGGPHLVPQAALDIRERLAAADPTDTQ